MRLAVVSPFVDRRHGTERALAELLDRLARDYHCEIHLFAQHVEDLPVIHWNPRHSTKGGVIFWHPVPAVRGPLLFTFVTWFLLNRLWRWAFTFFRHSQFALVLSPGINCSDADVIIVHALFQRLRELSRDQNAATPPPRSRFRRAHRRAYYALLAALERRIYTNPRIALAAVSQRTATQLADYFHRSDVRVIPNGVDTVQFSPSNRLARRAEARNRRSLQSGDFVLLLIGNDWDTKGLATLLRSMALVPDLPLHLVVVGSDSPELFQDMSKRLGVFDRCLWEKPSNEVLDFYAAADLYVSPSREDSFGLPVAEAMAAGLPVITSVFAGVSDLLHDGIDGFVLGDPLDAPTLAKLFQLLYSQPELRERMGSAAARTALAWTWDRNAASIWELLRNLAGN